MKRNLGKQHDATNLFGGKNAHGLYVPMSEDEQEVLHRLVQADDIVLIIHGWGYLDKPRILVGDHRVGVHFRLTFDRPASPMQVYFFDLELKTRTGISLVKERLPSIYNGQPVTVQAGLYLDMAWDIAIHSMDPRLVRALKPGTHGLTSRRQDKDTGEMTMQGNMKLDFNQKAVLRDMEAEYAKLRAEDLRGVISATEKAGYTVQKTKDGILAPEV